MDITGVEFAGIIEETGNSVINLKKGDKVFGTTTGLKYGANAEFVSVPEKSKMGVIKKMPDGISFNEAAAIPVGAMTALHLLKKVSEYKNKEVLIYGASGSVGSYAVQIAKYFEGYFLISFGLFEKNMRTKLIFKSVRIFFGVLLCVYFESIWFKFS